MNEFRSVIQGLGHFFPETTIDNEFLESLDIGTTPEWIEQRTGIRTRYSVLDRDDITAIRDKTETNDSLRAKNRIPSLADMMEAPWIQALDRAGLSQSPNVVDVAIGGFSVPDTDIPANACLIADRLGLEATAFDVNSSCTSFVVDIHVARAMMSTGMAQKMAVFNGERYTTRVDYSDRTSCVLWGDSATCAIVGNADSDEGLEVLDSIVGSESSGAELIKIPDSGFFVQDGATVQKFAIKKSIEITHEILSKNGLGVEDIHYIVQHQANLPMIASTCRILGIPEDKHLYNVDTRGNQGACGCATVLSENWERFNTDDLIVVPVVGAGLTWGALLLKRT